MTKPAPTLGTFIRNLRDREGLTLKQMSEKCGIPVSTLSKVEHDRLTLTYDKLYQLSQRLGLRMSDLFAENEDSAPAVTARRSLGRVEDAVRVETPNYDYYYLCTELRQKRMIPIITRIRAKTLDEFGDLVRHAGEEYVHVLEGGLILHSEFYDPVLVKAGEGIYIDSNMGHAYVAAEDCDEALVLAVCSSSEESQMNSLLSLHEPRLVEPRRVTTPPASLDLLAKRRPAA